MTVPPHKNRTPEQILDAKRLFDSAWHFCQALSWLDYAKRKTNISALQYAALELRQGIEHLWFDMVITAVGGELDIREYECCKGDSTKMYKVLERLSPDHAKLVRFTNISGSIDRRQQPVTEWDMPKLKRLHGEISQYLHFFGIPSQTTDSPKWFLHALTTIETGADYIWHQLRTTYTGQFKVASMPPAVRETWEAFRIGQLDEDSVRTRLHLAQPVLRKYMNEA
jgi:hypothetical protein